MHLGANPSPVIEFLSEHLQQFLVESLICTMLPHLTWYTPISDPDAKGYFDLLIKVYPEGKMSQHFASLNQITDWLMNITSMC
ncbi:uncharacterized protein LOC107420910 isoform X2 [Ziziphus jujuba]|uniref:cytochrome-b5 reductase n=1 Tax=Ziziphus jujuba TaxID=326968 RepID=A0ABM3ZSH1_ZIZJJ|nr:uncharacterized protein LOC107420910 isoform X2 [Ziziphus jujuba]